VRYSFDGRDYVGPILDVIHIPAQVELSPLVVESARRSTLSLISYVFVMVERAAKDTTTIESIAVALPLDAVRFDYSPRLLGGVVEYDPLPVLLI